MQEKDGCYKAQPRGLYTVCVSNPVSEIPLRRQSRLLEAISQEEAECGQGSGGNKGELGEKPPWLHISKKHERESLQLNIPCAGKITRIDKEYQRNEEDEQQKHRPFKRKSVEYSSHKFINKYYINSYFKNYL